MMAGIDYADLSSVAAAELANAGGPGTYRHDTREAGGAYDPAAGEAVQTVVEYPVSVAMFPFGSIASGVSSAAGTQIEVGDMQAFVSSPTIFSSPGPGDSLYFGGRWWRVINIKTTAPDGVTAVIHEMHVRR